MFTVTKVRNFQTVETIYLYLKTAKRKNTAKNINKEVHVKQIEYQNLSE